jgi:phage shock protein A
LLATQRGNEEAARLAMSRAIAIERLLPKISEQVAQAEQLVVAAKEKLYREREKLEAYQTEMQNMKALSEINEALETIAKVDTSFNLNSARSQFESAQAAVEGRYLKANAQAELSESHTERMPADLDRLTLNDEISRRLANLKSEQS